MQLQLLFLSIAPVLVFALVRQLGFDKHAVLAAIVTSAAELAFNSLRLGSLEWYSLASFTLFAIMGSMSISRHDLRYFKFQPVVFEVGMGLVWLAYYLSFDIRLFQSIVRDTVGLFELVETFERDYYELYARTLSVSLPYLLFVHAAATAFTALRAPTWVWLTFRTVGLYGMIAILFVAERLLRVTY